MQAKYRTSDCQGICGFYRTYFSDRMNLEMLFTFLNLPVTMISQVGFTLSQATKALRESRGIALLYFRPLHQKGVRGQRHPPAALYPRERPGAHCTGGWVGLRAGLDWCGKSRPTGIRSPDRQARRQSLCRLRYPAHYDFLSEIKMINSPTIDLA